MSNITYLKYIVTKHYLLLSFLLIFCLIQIHFNLEKKHSFPWFVWDMYSKTENINEYYSQIIVCVNSAELDYLTLPYWKGIAVERTIKSYNYLRKNNFNDPMSIEVDKKTMYLNDRLKSFVNYKLLNRPEEISTFPAWLLEFIEKNTKLIVRDLEVYEVWYLYNDGVFMPTGGKELIIKITKMPS
jgi:hypothetical protein